jgi:hypothetical protein
LNFYLFQVHDFNGQYVFGVSRFCLSLFEDLDSIYHNFYPIKIEKYFNKLNMKHAQIIIKSHLNVGQTIENFKGFRMKYIIAIGLVSFQ